MHHARRTLAGPARLEGLGLFTARPATLRLLPAEPGAGLVFRGPGGHLCPAHAERLTTVPGLPGRNTCLAAAGLTVLTTEHALSALAGLGVTDAVLELDGPELPILDGSALPFARAALDAGLRDLPPAPPHAGPLTLREPVTVASPDGRATITASPRARAGASFTYHLDYGPGAPLAPQRFTFDTATHDYARDLAPARTFCLEHEALALRAAGLFTHLSPRDLLVLGEGGRPIDNALRFPDEPARHKALDLVGDLALVGRPLQIDVVATRAGHALNGVLARALLAAGI